MIIGIIKNTFIKMAKIVSSIDIGTNTVTLLIAKIDNSKIVSIFEAEK